MAATTRLSERNDRARAIAQGWFECHEEAWAAVCTIANAGRNEGWWFAAQILPAEVRYRDGRIKDEIEACEDGPELADRALAEGWRLLSEISSATHDEIAEIRPGTLAPKRIKILRAVATLEETCSAD